MPILDGAELHAAWRRRNEDIAERKNRPRGTCVLEWTPAERAAGARRAREGVVWCVYGHAVERDVFFRLWPTRLGALGIEQREVLPDHVATATDWITGRTIDRWRRWRWVRGERRRRARHIERDLRSQ